MKFILTPETEEEVKNFESQKWGKELVIENIYQLFFGGNYIKQKVMNIAFRHSIINNVNDLIGIVESIKEDIKDFKHGNHTR